MIMSPQDSETIMRVMLPVIITVFTNTTSKEYQMSFKKPCEFDDLLKLFSSLPPYINEIGKMYMKNDRNDLIAYYSMQLSSTFLVNRKALTMKCLYQMLDLQTRIGGLSIGIMDKPDEYENLVGLMGKAMQPMMKPLRSNPMLKLIEYVDKYEKNTDLGTVQKFNVFNIIFVIMSLIGILGNISLICLLYKSYKLSTKNYYYKIIHKRYKTKLCLIIIAACNCMYLLNNFIIMSQFNMAASALGGLNKFNLACKLAFTLFPPTTAYTLLKQISIWLLIYALRKHHFKIRTIKLHDNFYLLNNYTNTISTIGNRNNNAHMGLVKRNRYTNSMKQENVKWVLAISLVMFIYNAPMMFLYSLAVVKPENHDIVYYCAFNQNYAERLFTFINSYFYPIGNLILFVFVPLIIGTLYILFDVCYLVRMYREETKRFECLKNFIEYPLYVYFALFYFCEMFYAFHQVYDLFSGAIQFPFVFPLFIRMTFSNKVNLVIFEMFVMCLACSSMFFIWLICDRTFLKIIKEMMYKYILCRSTNSFLDVGEHHNIIVEDAELIKNGVNKNLKTNATSSSSSGSTSATSTSVRSKEEVMKGLCKTINDHVGHIGMIDDNFNDYCDPIRNGHDMNTYKSVYNQK